MEAIRNPLTPGPPLPGSECDEKVLCQMVLFNGIVQWVDLHQNETASPQNSLINKHLWIKLSPIAIVAVPCCSLPRIWHVGTWTTSAATSWYCWGPVSATGLVSMLPVRVGAGWSLVTWWREFPTEWVEFRLVMCNVHLQIFRKSDWKQSKIAFWTGLLETWITLKEDYSTACSIYIIIYNIRITWPCRTVAAQKIQWQQYVSTWSMNPCAAQQLKTYNHYTSITIIPSLSPLSPLSSSNNERKASHCAPGNSTFESMISFLFLWDMWSFPGGYPANHCFRSIFSRTLSTMEVCGSAGGL